MARVQIIQASPNVVKIGQEASTVSIMEQKTSVSIQASIIVTDVVESTGDSTPHALVAPLVVTNNDIALGDAVGKTYGAETTFEEIFGDILHPVIDSTFGSLGVVISRNGGIYYTVANDATFEFGESVLIAAFSSFFLDVGNECDDTANLILDITGGPSDQFFSVNNLNITGWEQKSGADLILNSSTNLNSIFLQETQARTKTFSFNYELNAINSANNSYLVESPIRRFFFHQRKWALLSSVEATEESILSTNFNEFLASSEIVDTNLSSSKTWTSVDVGNITNDKWFYIAIPTSLNIDVTVADNINTGTVDVATAFLFVGYLLYDTNFTDSNNSPITFNVRLYRTYQSGAFPPGTSLNIYPD